MCCADKVGVLTQEQLCDLLHEFPQAGFSFDWLSTKMQSASATGKGQVRETCAQSHGGQRKSPPRPRLSDPARGDLHGNTASLDVVQKRTNQRGAVFLFFAGHVAIPFRPEQPTDPDS